MVLPRKCHQWRVACYENDCARYFWKTDNRMAKLTCFYRRGTLLCDKVTEEAEGVCYAVSNKPRTMEELDMAIMHVTKNNFQEEVIQSDRPVLLDFWANWCGPCRMVGPVVEEIARERPDVKVDKIDVDEQRELAAAFQIMSIPTLVVMQDGKVTQQVVGLRPKEQILAMLDRGN